MFHHNNPGFNIAERTGDARGGGQKLWLRFFADIMRNFVVTFYNRFPVLYVVETSATEVVCLVWIATRSAVNVHTESLPDHYAECTGGCTARGSIGCSAQPLNHKSLHSTTTPQA